MYKIIIFALCAYILLPQQLKGQDHAEMSGVKAGAYENYFQYFNQSDSAQPVEARTFKGSIVGVLNPETDDGLGTAVLLHTSRKDKKKCLCMTGHQGRAIAFARHNDETNAKFGIVMNYTGIDSNGYNKTITGSNAILHNAQMVAYSGALYPEPGMKYAPDIALFLVNAEEFTAPYLEARYSLDNITMQNNLLVMGYPHNLPLKLADSLTPNLVTSSIFEFSGGHQGNYLAPGYSGAPVISKGNGGKVHGVLNGALIEEEATFIAVEEMIIPDILSIHKERWSSYSESYKNITLQNFGIRYSPTSRATYLSFISDSIKKYCWPDNKDSFALTKAYETSIVVQDNADALQQFGRVLNIGNTAQLSAAASATYAQTYPGNVLVRGQSVNVSCEIVPGSSSKKVLISSTLTTLASGFSYTASGDYQLDVSSVVLGPYSTMSTINKQVNLPWVGPAENSPLPDSAKFIISPNPSSSGLFTLLIPDRYGKSLLNASITDMGGKEIWHRPVNTGGGVDIDLSEQAKGVYLFVIHDHKQRIQFSAKLVYR